MDYSEIITAIEALPFADLLRLNADLATLLKKEGKSGAVGKAAKKEKKDKDPDAPKRAPSAGTAAWFAFVKHCKSAFGDRFEGISKESEKLSVCKAIRSEDEAAYLAFVARFKTEHPELADKKPVAKKAKKARTPSDDEDSDAEESESEGEAASPAPAPAPKKPLTAEEKLAKLAALKKGAAGGASSASAAASSPAPAAAASAPKKAEKKPKEEKPKKEPKKAKTPAPATPPAAEEEEAAMPKKTIGDTTYWFDPETNGLWQVTEEGEFGAWVGHFQPEDEDAPIRFTDGPDV